MANEPLTGKRILVTGVTGWVAGPLAISLAALGNEVFGAARFADPMQRQSFEVAGVQTVSIDMGKGRFDEVPDGLDHLLHFEVAKSQRFESALATNAEGTANLMAAVAETSPGVTMLHCSSTAVYEPNDGSPLKETDRLGDSHRLLPGMHTYSIAKIATEVLVQHTAKRLNIPTVIARLNVPYGDTYGWMLFHLAMMEKGMDVPVYIDQPTSYSPIHADDIAASIPYLLELASTPPTIINWGGEAVASVEEWCRLMGSITGLTPGFAPTPATLPTIIPDITKQLDTGFRCTVDWRDGIRRMVHTSRPDLVLEGNVPE